MKNIKVKVFKVGGSVLAEPKDFLKIAERILQFNDSNLCIVTSAMKGKTDELIKIYTSAIPELEFWNFEQFVGMGEIQAALLFESAFRHFKVKARAIIPGMREWPVHIKLRSSPSLSHVKTNEKRDFEVLAKCQGKIKKYIRPILEKNNVLIIPGFVAQDSTGKILTLGRGGSDISALLMAELLSADELILIKDVDGILSLDPKFVANGTRIRSMAWEELGVLAASGSPVLNPISLKHRKNLPKMRVISNRIGSYENAGTEISFGKETTICASRKTFAALTFIGEKLPETPGILSEISGLLSQRKIPIHSITISDNIIACYVEERDSEQAYVILSRLIVKIKNLKALNIKKSIARIVIRSLKFINEPGIIEEIVKPIGRQGINIWEILTVHTDIMLFVETSDLGKALAIVRSIFTKNITKK